MIASIELSSVRIAGSGDTLFSVDCTGRMSSEIDQVRLNIQNIVDEPSLIIDDVTLRGSGPAFARLLYH